MGADFRCANALAFQKFLKILGFKCDLSLDKKTMGVLFLSNTPIVQIKEIKPNKRITHCVLVLRRMSCSFGCQKMKKT